MVRSGPALTAYAAVTETRRRGAAWGRNMLVSGAKTSRSRREVPDDLLTVGDERGGIDALAPVGRDSFSLLTVEGFTLAADESSNLGIGGTCPGEVPLGLRASTDQRFTVILAEHDGAVCGMNVVSALGDTMVGIIGATTYEGAKRYAAYLLEWAAMELAHHSGQVRYDMGGIDPDDNPGGYDFKRGTRGDDLTGAGPAECKPAGFRAAVAEHGERVYRAIRRAAKNRAAGAVSINGESQQGESA